MKTNLEFHEKIAKASKNRVMYNVHQSINNLVKQYQVYAVTVPGVMNESLRFQKEILSNPWTLLICSTIKSRACSGLLFFIASFVFFSQAFSNNRPVQHPAFASEAAMRDFGIE